MRRGSEVGLTGWGILDQVLPPLVQNRERSLVFWRRTARPGVSDGVVGNLETKVLTIVTFRLRLNIEAREGVPGQVTDWDGAA